MKLSVIIVSYNVCYYVEQCIDSVLRATEGIEAEVLVVDNHSQDGTVEHLRQTYGDRLHLIESTHNVGFARANNIAIRQSQGEYVLLLNPDTFVGEMTLKKALEFMDANQIAGAAGMMMHNVDGTRAPESRRAIPTPWVSLKKIFGFSRGYYMSHLSWQMAAPIPIISGACFLIRRKALDLFGLLDEDYFMYGEDIDLSFRLHHAPYVNYYLPYPIVHYKGESTQKSSFRYVHVFYQAMLIFFRKHYAHLSWLLALPIKAAIYGCALIALVKMLSQRVRCMLGFSGRRQQAQSYLFVGSEEMICQCKRLVERKGLTAEFASAMPEDMTPYEDAIVVYDVDSVGYDAIISHIAQHAGHFRLGTYSTRRHVLITHEEVIV